MATPSFDIDVEKGIPVPIVTQREASTTPSIAAGNTKSQLEIFQTLVGIEYLVDGGGTKSASRSLRRLTRAKQSFLKRLLPQSRTDCNRGLYDRATSYEWSNSVLYSASNYIISSFYLLQILLAATFTALSAYQESSSVSLTVLGAINTVVAGILAWLKGQGMPNRFRLARDQYREVVRDIEMTERMFAEARYLEVDRKLDPVKERDRLERLFEDARQDQMANYPDTHVNLSERRKAGEVERSVESKDRDRLDLTRELEELKKKIAEVHGAVKVVEAVV